jgi:hypothetical protein
VLLLPEVLLLPPLPLKRVVLVLLLPRVDVVAEVPRDARVSVPVKCPPLPLPLLTSMDLVPRAAETAERAAETALNAEDKLFINLVNY